MIAFEQTELALEYYQRININHLTNSFEKIASTVSFALHFKEGWPSGLRRTPGKRVGVQAPRGFESLPLCW